MQAVPSDNGSSCSPENGARNTLFIPEHLRRKQARCTQAAPPPSVCIQLDI